MEKIYYKEKQIFYISIIPALLIILLLIYAEVFNLGSKPMPLFATIISVVIFLSIILLTYNMVITISKSNIIVKFGIGILRKVIKIDEIDINNIKKVNIKWYNGMGIRIIKDGFLYNTKQGYGVFFTTKTKSFILGTRNPDKLISNIKHLRQQRL